jgi:hypothetical protein
MRKLHIPQIEQLPHLLINPERFGRVAVLPNLDYHRSAKAIKEAEADEAIARQAAACEAEEMGQLFAFPAPPEDIVA